jgi:hypothetical protein
MGYWTDRPFSKRSTSTSSRSSKTKPEPERGKVIASTKTKPDAPKRCPACQRTRCGCSDVGDAIKTRRGTPRDRLDDKGIVWCGVCKSRTHMGTCMNVQCSTRK